MIGLEYRGFVLSSRIVPDRTGSTRTGHTEWSGRGIGGGPRGYYYRRWPLTCGSWPG